MRLKTKIIIPFTLMLLIAVGALGMWSVSIIHDNAEERSYVYLHSILSSYMSDTVYYHQDLLEQNNLDSVPSYVKQYQELALKSAENIPFYLSGWIMVFDSQGKVIFHTDASDRGKLDTFWENTASSLTALPEGEMLHSISGETLFAGVYFEPWDWYVAAAINESALDTSTQDVTRATIIWVAVILLLSLFVLYWGSQKILLKPIGAIRDAANHIASGTYTEHISVGTSDDLGELARDMEKMSVSLQEKEQDLREANKTLEARVAERTASLHKESLRLEEENEAHKRTEAALRETEAQYRNIIDYSPDAIFINYEDRVFLVNEACIKLFGAQSSHQLVGMNIYDCFHPTSHEIIKERIHELREENHPVPVDVEQIVRLDGRAVDVEVTAAPFPFKNSRGIHVILRDVTEKHKLEEQLRQSRKMDSIGRLAGGVAHDFNNMLSVIIGFTQLSLEKIEATNPLYQDLQEVLKAANRSADLTKQLLAFSRKQTIDPKVTDLNEALERILKMLEKLIGEDIDLAWIPSKNPGLIFIDPSQIDQILTNLCINARNAVDEGGMITIETHLLDIDEEYCAAHAGFYPGEFVLLAVSDNGCGMDKETLDKVFEPFFSLKMDQGTGLGLSTVYGIVKQNSGFIHVYSEPEEGSTFKIYFPKYCGDALKPEVKVSADIPKGLGQTILLVEDESELRSMAQAMLEQLGYAVLSAENPQDALKLAEENRRKITLLLTDVVMPGMNGRELSEKLQKISPKLKTLFMSGYTANVIAHQGVLDTGIHFIQKPFSIRNLAESIHEALL